MSQNEKTRPKVSQNEKDPKKNIIIYIKKVINTSNIRKVRYVKISYYYWSSK